MPPNEFSNDTEGPLSELRSYLRRREFVKAAGVGVGSAVTGVGTAAAQSGGPFSTGPTELTWPAATLDVGSLTEATPPEDPDIGGQGGSSEIEEIERLTPSGSGSSGGPSGSPLVESGGDSLSIDADFDGLSTRDVVRGVDLDDSGDVEDDEIFFAIPPDPQIGVGSTHIVESINSEVGIFEKASGDRLAHFRLEDWFANVLSLAPDDEPAAQFENIQVFDPRVRYDRAADRYLIACVEFNLPDTRPDNTIGDGDEDAEPDPVPDPNDLTGAYLLSISDTADPFGTWTNYRIPPLQGDPPTPVQGDDPTPGLVDFPQLGYGPEAVYLTQNFFALTSGGFLFVGATMEILDKADLLAGDDVRTLHFTGLRNADGSLAFTVQPATQHARASGDDAFYLLNTRFFHGETLTVWSVTDPTDSGAVSVTNDPLAVRPYNNPPNAKQPETEETIDMGDTRIVDAIAYDETDGNLWAAHTINDGSARWYEVDPAGPSVVQSQTFKREGLPTFFPVVATNGDSAMMVYNVSGPKSSDPQGANYARIGVAGRTNDFQSGQLEDAVVVKAGESAYDYVSAGEGDQGTQELRWGDYNGIQVDPDDGSYWLVSEYANDPETVQTYGTRIANVDFDE